ncbi:Uncharacterised protein [Mycobacteroides abscessus subsp. abscessus]|nr:Uncharacterised protein [Mycobacteroides abscessus subsp. abscessus]
MVGGEQLAGTPEPGGDLVEDQQHTMPVADGAQLCEIPRIVKSHPTGALHYGLDDDRRKFGSVFGQLRFETPHVLAVVGAGDTVGKDLLDQHVGPQ